MPDLATTDSAMKVVQWLVEIGQPVTRGEPILEIETDKATMELEAIASGILKTVHVQPEDEVTEGQLIATLEAEGSTKTPAAKTVSEPATESKAKRGMFARNRAGSTVSAKPEEEAESPAISLSTTQRLVARRMKESKQSIPHFYLQTSANAQPLIARRQAATPSTVVWDAFFVNAAAIALSKFERMGYHFDKDRLEPCKSDVIGVAVDLEGELFVIPVAKPSVKSPEIISDEIRAAVSKLKSGDPEARKLHPAKLTITNLGATGIESFTAIVNPPEAAILAIGKVAPVGVVEADRVVPQHRVSITLSVDHRVVSGKYAAEFLQATVQELESL